MRTALAPLPPSMSLCPPCTSPGVPAWGLHSCGFTPQMGTCLGRVTTRDLTAGACGHHGGEADVLSWLGPTCP